jgi:hypothetical protein
MSKPYDVDWRRRAWHQRFSFFVPRTSGIDIAGPSRIQGVAVLAFFFGPIHYFVKDMWRKGLTLRAAAIGIGSNRR